MTDSLGIAEANPLRQSLRRTRVPEPCAVVLFGATGDLAHRKLMPALYHLSRGGHLPGEFAVVGFARRDWSDDDLRAEFEKSMSKSLGSDFAEFWPQFASHVVFVPGTFDGPEGYAKLKELVIVGYFTSKPVQTDILKVVVVPGRYDPNVPMAPPSVK